MWTDAQSPRVFSYKRDESSNGYLLIYNRPAFNSGFCSGLQNQGNMRWHSTLFFLFVAVLKFSESVPIAERNKLILYHGSNQPEIYQVAEGTQILKSQNFDNSKKTVIYVHGYIENQTSVSVRTVVEAYNQRNDYNIITLDWKEDASGSYLFNAFPNSMKVGDVVSKAVLNMIEEGLSVERLHLVGHSLGGQMVGRIGGEVKRRSGGRVVLKRISALDPAFPGFYGPFLKHITKDDAEFVDVIHTDAWIYGAPASTGTVDFWPNSGSALQPGCPTRHDIFQLDENDLCSHWRSWRYWAESLNQKNSQQFHAVPAKNWRSFKQGNVGEYDPKVVMGNECPSSASGDYYLQTNAEAPFARGEAGTSYTSDERIMSDVNSNFIDNEHLGDSLGNYNEKTYAESPSY
ncbi:lipase member H-A-like isoform X2 [Hermetia illucens]|uniref:lipase member H-A-like isoform X2 n=1 Tax=Hermetia illucens TaxID=343691 RepID=UPI0018CBF419|nr:lipase member H-A-like isoform X2 [Hermetia illucens]